MNSADIQFRKNKERLFFQQFKFLEIKNNLRKVHSDFIVGDQKDYLLNINIQNLYQNFLKHQQLHTTDYSFFTYKYPLTKLTN